MKTYILLDNDGVTNALSTKKLSGNKAAGNMTGWSNDRWYERIIETYPIQWNTEVVDELNDLIWEDDNELVVLSTWEYLSMSSYYPILGIKAPVTTKVLENKYDESFSASWGGSWNPWWKLQAVRDFCETLEEDCRIVWIDDDLDKFRYSVDQYTKEHPLVDFLLVSPDSALGLTKKNFNSIREFINDTENTGVECVL